MINFTLTLPATLGPDSHTMKEGPPLLSNIAKCFVGLALSTVILWGVIGNASVCYIIFKDLKLSVTNLFLLNLSLADILIAIFSGPFVTLNDFIVGHWAFGIGMCKIMPLVQGTSSFVSALTHVVISFDRFVVVFRPLKPRIRLKSAVYILSTIWIFSALIMLPLPIVYDVKFDQNLSYCLENWSIFIKGNYTQDEIKEKANFHNFLYTILLMVLQFFLPLTVIVGTYSAIAFRIWIRETPGEVDLKRDQRIAKSKRKLLKMVILVALLYGLSHLPRHVLFLASLRNSEMWNTEYSVYVLYIWLFCILAEQSSMGFNPLIYFWMNKLFRRGFIRIFAVTAPCCADKSSCCQATIQDHRCPNDRNTYNLSSNYEKTIIFHKNTKKSSAINAACFSYSSQIKLVNQKHESGANL